MDACCGISDSEWKAREAQRLKTEEEAMNLEVTVNGAKLQVKDLFPDYWAARDFVSKLNLLSKSAGGKALMDTSPMSVMDDEPQDEGDME